MGVGVSAVGDDWWSVVGEGLGSADARWPMGKDVCERCRECEELWEDPDHCCWLLLRWCECELEEWDGES